MHAFDVLSDTVRQRALELMSQRQQVSGDIVKVVEAEFVMIYTPSNTGELDAVYQLVVSSYEFVTGQTLPDR